MYTWAGFVSLIVVPALIGMVYFQQFKIAGLQAHVSAVSEMNAECFSRIIKN